MAKKLCMGCMCEYDDKFSICPSCGYIEGTKAKEDYHLAPGSVIGEKYIVGRAIGFGGFGITYIGFDYALERKVAIKEYLPNEFATRCQGENTVTVFTNVEKEEQFASGLNKFSEEASRLKKFDKVPNVVTVFDTFKENNTAYIVMEYLEGETLSEKLRREKKISYPEALNYIVPILDSLEVLHKDNMIHRDIAPDNIFVTKDNKVKLIDFGAARYASSTHSKSLSVIVKEGYAPPEQYRSRGDQGPWTDVYACAATMYRMITGVKPEESINRMEKDTLVKPSKLGADIPKNAEIALMNALNLKIEDRTESAKAFREELLSEGEVARRKVTLKKLDIGKWPIWAKISSGAAAAAILLVASLMITGVISFNPKDWVTGIGKTRVPLVVNTNLSYAESRISDANMIMQITDKLNSDEIPKDLILSQSIEDGTVVNEKGTVLEVVVSAGGEIVYMPDYEGMKASEVYKELEEYGVYFQEKEQQESEIAPGCIIKQDIEPGTETEKGSNINFVISSGMSKYDMSKSTEVPDIVGKNWKDSRKAIADNKLYIYIVKKEYSDTVPEGQIISQNVEAGKNVKQGTEIGIVLSLGITKVRVPDVQYKDFKDAEQLLSNAKLNVNTIREDSDTVARNRVIRQDIASGTEVDAYTVVTIYVSNGNPNVNVREDVSNNNNSTEVAVNNDTAKTNTEQQEAGNEQPKEQANNTQKKTEQPKETKEQPPKEEDTKTKEPEPELEPETQAIEDNRPTVPDVTHKNVTSSLSELKGFNVEKVYRSSSTYSDGTILYQNPSSGVKVNEGSTLVLYVVDNSSHKEYRYRMKKPRTVTTTTSTKNAPEGYTYVREESNTTYGNWGGWSSWSTNPVSESNTRKVETTTGYLMGRWKSGDRWDPYNFGAGVENCWVPVSEMARTYEYDYKLSNIGASGEVYYISYYGSNGLIHPFFHNVRYSDGGYAWVETTPMYRYCDRSENVNTTYYWSKTVYDIDSSASWSNWSRTMPTGDDKEIETQTVQDYPKYP